MKRKDEFRVLLVTTFRKNAFNNLHIVRGIVQGIEDVVADSGLNACVEYTLVEDAYFKITQFKPSLMIVFGSALREDIDFGTLTALAKKVESKTVFWASDDPYEFDVRYRFLDHFDLICTNDFGTQLYYFNDEKVLHLPLAASMSNDYREICLKKDIEFFFCGYPYKNRKVAMQDLCKVISPTRITLSKGDWGIEGCNFVEVENHSCLVELYSKSKYVLNIGRSFNLANAYYHINPTTPGPRTFEAALAGTVQIYLSASSEISNYYAPNSEILISDNVNSIPELIENSSNNQECWASIANAAQSRTRRNHCYSHRIKELFDMLI